MLHDDVSELAPLSAFPGGALAEPGDRRPAPARLGGGGRREKAGRAALGGRRDEARETLRRWRGKEIAAKLDASAAGGSLPAGGSFSGDGSAEFGGVESGVAGGTLDRVREVRMRSAWKPSPARL